MLRNASLNDFQFIFTLVRVEAKNGHFALDPLIPATTRDFELELKSVLASKVRLNGTHAYAMIYEKNDVPIGFVIMSFNLINNVYELWVAGIWPRHRDKKEGKTMISELLSLFKGKNIDLMARCAPASEAMFHILTTKGFRHVDTSKQGYRALICTL